MSRYTIDEFVQQTRQKDLGQGLFELESERMLELNLNGSDLLAFEPSIQFDIKRSRRMYR